jgi:hypothetical protein
MYGLMRSWLKIGAIENDEKVKAEIAAVEYGFNVRDEIQLESKADLKRRLPRWARLTMLTPSPLPLLIPWPPQPPQAGHGLNSRPNREERIRAPRISWR